MKKESDVNIKGSKEGGYIIQVNDQITENNLAVTHEELERIVLYGQQILKSEKS